MIRSRLTLLLLAIVSTSSSGVAGQTVRLADGASPWEGRVEVLHDGAWGTVCDNHFGLAEARVVCRQLGYNDIAQASVRNAAEFGPGTGDIIFDDLQCNGFEQSLISCHRGRIGENDCSHSQDAGVSCGVDGGNGCLTNTPCVDIAVGCLYGVTEVVEVAFGVCPICRCTHLVNVALYKPANQSTFSIYGVPERAVDGGTGVSIYYCTETVDPDPNPNRWWRVDLQADYEVQSVVITNRGDCCGFRLANFDITVSRDRFNPFEGFDPSVRCLHQDAALGDGVTVSLACTQPVLGRYVTLILHQTTWPLHFCEMKVLAQACPPDPECPQNCEGGRTEFYYVAYCRMCRCLLPALLEAEDETEKDDETDTIPLGLLIAMCIIMVVMVLICVVVSVCFLKHTTRNRVQVVSGTTKKAPTEQQANWIKP